MKRIFCYLAAFLLAFSLFFQPAAAWAQTANKRTPFNENDIYARSAVLMDASTGRVLFGKNAENPMPMASTTKIMTCILTLEQADLEDIVTVSAYAAKMPDVRLHIAEGEHYRLEDLLYSMMLESHNDSAAALAEHVGGSVEGFAQMMNEKAVSIGCADTFFITPNGLDASVDITQPDGTTVKKVHSTTASDLARILSYCIKESPQKEKFLEITRTAGYSFQNLHVAKDGSTSAGPRSFSCNNHNAFLHMMEGAMTGKTGFTGDAGYCYTGALERDGRTFVIALLACGWPTNKTWKWKDAKKLFQYGIDNYKQTDITNYDYVPQPITVEDAAGSDRLLKTQLQLPLHISQQAQNMLLSECDQVEVRAALPKKLRAPVKAGKQVGTLNYYVNGELTAQMPVTASRSVAKRTLWWYFMLVVSRYFYPYFN